MPRSVLVAAGALLVVILLLGILVSPILAILLLVLALGAAAWAWASAERVVLGQVGGVAASPNDQARLHNQIDALCSTAGVAKPDVRVLDDPAANACVIGRGEHATLVVTTGLLGLLEVIELEGVIAHELAHLKTGDHRAGTLVAALASVVPSLSAARVADGREANADAAAVTLTRYPPGLLAALEKLAAVPFEVRSGWRTTRHLWLVQTSDEVAGRIDTLREM